MLPPLMCDGIAGQALSPQMKNIPGGEFKRSAARNRRVKQGVIAPLGFISVSTLLYDYYLCSGVLGPHN